MIISSLALTASIFYIRFCFFCAARRVPEGKRTVYFLRGTFSRDVDAMKQPADVLLDGRILRRLFRFTNEPHKLEQIVCLYYAPELRDAFATVITTLVNECEKHSAQRACFGGIDYFETTIFEKGLRENGVETIAIFHENYTIPLVVKQTANLLSSYPEVPNFSKVFAIGPPAMNILKQLFNDVRPHDTARFSYSQECLPFERDLSLIPFADIAYFAPTAFAVTYALLVDMRKRLSLSIIIKHKNNVELKKFTRTFGNAVGMQQAINPSASILAATSRVVICFNSLVYFEALARGHLIAIPNFAEARQDEFYSQHKTLPEGVDAGIRFFSSPEELEAIMKEASELHPSDRCKWEQIRRSLLNQNFYCSNIQT